MYILKFKRSARDDLKGLRNNIQKTIAIKLKLLADDTHAYALDIQTIKGKPGYFRLRSGSYRVIYYKDEDAPEGKTILVVGIKHRSDAYA